jgi:hypothetical protein
MKSSSSYSMSEKKAKTAALYLKNSNEMDVQGSTIAGSRQNGSHFQCKLCKVVHISE